MCHESCTYELLNVKRAKTRDNEVGKKVITSGGENFSEWQFFVKISLNGNFSDFFL